MLSGPEGEDTAGVVLRRGHGSRRQQVNLKSVTSQPESLVNMYVELKDRYGEGELAVLRSQDAVARQG